eukprot:5640971-Amphidinium_carterae.1
MGNRKYIRRKGGCPCAQKRLKLKPKRFTPIHSLSCSVQTFSSRLSWLCQSLKHIVSSWEACPGGLGSWCASLFSLAAFSSLAEPTTSCPHGGGGRSRLVAHSGSLPRDPEMYPLPPPKSMC